MVAQSACRPPPTPRPPQAMAPPPCPSVSWCQHFLGTPKGTPSAGPAIHTCCPLGDLAWPADTKMGMACASGAWEGGGGGSLGLPGLACVGWVGSGAQRVCSLLVRHPSRASFSREDFRVPRF